jgi:hypothetical protein
MSLTLSPQMKIFALLGLVAVLALGVGSMMLGRTQSPSSATPLDAPLKHMPRKTAAPAAAVKPAAKPAAHPAASAKKHAAAPAAKAHAKAAAPAAAKPAAAKHAATKATAHKAAAPKAKPKAVAPVVPAVATNGLPGALDMLLHGHRVVIVALWDPEIPSDRYAFLEAQAGAKAANAGFLAVSVLDERLAAPLTVSAGNGTVLPSPGVLVYKQPGTLMNKLDGFADREAIAEAVANAMLAEAPPQGMTPAAAAPAAPAG